MIELNNQFTIMKRRIDSEVVRRFFSDTLIETADRLPIEIIPKDRIPSRCCIYKERAMVRYRVLTLLGVDLDHEDDEFKPLGEYVKEVLEKDEPSLPLLTTIKSGCYGRNEMRFTRCAGTFPAFLLLETDRWNEKCFALRSRRRADRKVLRSYRIGIEKHGSRPSRTGTQRVGDRNDSSVGCFTPIAVTTLLCSASRWDSEAFLDAGRWILLRRVSECSQVRRRRICRCDSHRKCGSVAAYFDFDV